MGRVVKTLDLEVVGSSPGSGDALLCRLFSSSTRSSHNHRPDYFVVFCLICVSMPAAVRPSFLDGPLIWDL